MFVKAHALQNLYNIMRKKRTKIVDNVIQTVEGFEKVFKVIHQNTVLKRQMHTIKELPRIRSPEKFLQAKL